MKKIQAKKKRDKELAALEDVLSAPTNGQTVKSLLDDDDDTPLLFT